MLIFALKISKVKYCYGLIEVDTYVDQDIYFLDFDCSKYTRYEREKKNIAIPQNFVITLT